MQDLINTLKALSDETRLRIIHILFLKECCVCEVMQALDISQTRASRNLGILHKNGFLKTSRDGAWVVYSIDRETANKHSKNLAELLRQSSFNGRVYAADIKRLNKATRTGYGCRTKKES
jgi:ArsR family transcriptional regulator, arsenate/arsenite/antimonite-responsive transcriptional repressor